MDLHVIWGKPMPMRPSRQLIYDVDLERLPSAAGVYVFGRTFGDSFEALYVGKAASIRDRVEQQINNLRLMAHLRDAQRGSRVVLPGTVKIKRGQQVDKAILLVERALIRHFLSEGHELANKQGTKIPRHEIHSTRRPMRLVPQTMFLDNPR